MMFISLTLTCALFYIFLLQFGSVAAVIAFHLFSRSAYLFDVGFSLHAQRTKRFFTDRYGVERGFKKFKSWAALTMVNDAFSFCILAWVTRNSFPELVISKSSLIITGIILTIIGIGFKAWAKKSLDGSGGYFWKDFFIAKVEANYVPHGPYRFFKNPMYTIGDSHLYGIPLMLLSWLEKPHAEELYGVISKAPVTSKDPLSITSS